MDIIDNNLSDQYTRNSCTFSPSKIDVSTIVYENPDFEDTRKFLLKFTHKNVGHQEVKPLKISKTRKVFEEKANTRDLLMNQIRNHSTQDLKAPRDRIEIPKIIDVEDSKSVNQMIRGNLTSRRSKISDVESDDDWD